MKFPALLRVAIVTNMDLFIINTTIEENIQIVGGLESKLLSLLSDGLKFDPLIHIPKDKEWGRLETNGNWTGIIGLISRNEADIGISKLGITREKLSVVVFSYPYSIEKVTFATRPPNVMSKETAIIRPFSPNLRLAILVTFLSVIFSFKVIFGNTYTLQHISFTVFGYFLLKSRNLKFTKCSERVILSTFTFSVMLLSYCYTALLLSFLTFPFTEQPIDNKYRLQEVLNKKSYKCVTFAGSNLVHTLLNSEDKIVASIAEKISLNGWFIPPKKDSLINCFNSKGIVVINPVNHFRIVPKSEIFIAEDSFALLYSGIAVNKNFCCTENLNTMVHRILASGLYQKSESDFYFKSRLKNMKWMLNDTPTKKTLELGDVIGAFIFLLIGYIISITTLAIEICLKNISFYRTSNR